MTSSIAMSILQLSFLDKRFLIVLVNREWKGLFLLKEFFEKNLFYDNII
jgi:hypothetical protein